MGGCEFGVVYPQDCVFYPRVCVFYPRVSVFYPRVSVFYRRPPWIHSAFSLNFLEPYQIYGDFRDISAPYQIYRRLSIIYQQPPKTAVPLPTKNEPHLVQLVSLNLMKISVFHHLNYILIRISFVAFLYRFFCCFIRS